jgi:two-component system copper resistance phosphate regulon response regulator CusR
MRILIIDDEQKTVNSLRRGLTENGFMVAVACDGESGLKHARTHNYNLIILNVTLPERDGWSVFTELRRAGKRTPVFFLSARDSVQQRVKGLELGADDFLVKPFAFSELLARVRVILRRRAPSTQGIFCLADLQLDLVRQRAVRRGRPLDLTPTEFSLLSLLIRHSGKVLSREVIAQEVWGTALDGTTNVVDVHVRRLRSKVDDPFGHKLIQTVRGMGYVLEPRP